MSDVQVIVAVPPTVGLFEDEVVKEFVNVTTWSPLPGEANVPNPEDLTAVT